MKNVVGFLSFVEPTFNIILFLISSTRNHTINNITAHTECIEIILQLVE